jgi:hypothetical protein
MATESTDTTMNLSNEVTITNETGVHRFPKGQNVKVPKEMAEDVARIDYEHQQYKDNLHTKHVYEVNSGTMSVGGGTE